MTWWGWLLLGVAVVWPALAWLVALGLGRSIRIADQKERPRELR